MGASLKHQVSNQMLRKIIREELAVVLEGDDVSDAQERSTVIKISSDLMKSINAFKEKATASMMSHLDGKLSEVYKVLLSMSNDPHAYVDKQIVTKQPVKKTFKAEADVIK